MTSGLFVVITPLSAITCQVIIELILKVAKTACADALEPIVFDGLITFDRLEAVKFVRRGPQLGAFKLSVGSRSKNLCRTLAAGATRFSHMGCDCIH